MIPPQHQQKNKERKRNHQSIENHIKRSLKTLRAITSPQHKEKHQNKNKFKTNIKHKKIKTAKSKKQKHKN
jgi:hypothetical protein